ncbi:MAG: TRAM domain-containing protein [Candidatus Anstonellaceae archaeon]
MNVELEEGKIYKVKIEHLLPGNRGLTKIDGFPIYINNVNKKEEVKIKIVKIAKTYAQAEKI